MNRNVSVILRKIYSFPTKNSLRYFRLGTPVCDPPHDHEVHVVQVNEKTNEVVSERNFNQLDHFENLCRLANVKPRVGFIGGGNMAQALASGFLSTGMISKENVLAADPDPKVRKYWQDLDLKTFGQASEVLEMCTDSILILAVKPPSLPSLYKELHRHDSRKQIGLIVSVCAGTKIKTLEQNLTPLGKKLPIIRVMPNTPSLINCGAAVFSTGQHSTSAHSAIVQSLMETVGTCHQLTENMLDAVTGLSASGPAYVYTVVDAMSDGGVKMGLPRQLATHLAAQTVMGAAQMILKYGKHPGDLKNQVCSPGGTTIAGIHVLEEAGIRAAFMSAVEAATLKAKQLGQD